MTTKDVKYWLEEKELKTPEHDKMVLFVLENCKKILIEFGILPKNIRDEKKEIEYSLGNWGFIDFRYLTEKEQGINEYYFEVKPQVKSIGEIMRQINYYRKIVGDSNSWQEKYFILVTKTKGLKEIFTSQNVYVYEYEEQNGEHKPSVSS